MLSPDVLRFTHKSELSTDQKIELSSGLKFAEDFRLGIYAPEFSSMHVETDI